MTVSLIQTCHRPTLSGTSTSYAWQSGSMTCFNTTQSSADTNNHIYLAYKLWYWLPINGNNYRVLLNIVPSKYASVWYFSTEIIKEIYISLCHHCFFKEPLLKYLSFCINVQIPFKFHHSINNRVWKCIWKLVAQVLKWWLNTWKVNIIQVKGLQ